MTFRRVLVPAITLATAVILTGCSNDGSPGNAEVSTSSTPGTESVEQSPADGEWVNQQDLMFARTMVPHHEQAIEMADVLLAKPDVDVQLVDLANQIRGGRGPEVEQLTAWLEEWGWPLPEPGSSDTAESGPVDGTQSDGGAQTLAAAQGVDAGRLFLELMIANHRGAIEVARTEVEEGRHEGAVAMAQQTMDAHQAEISTMEALLAST